MNKSPSLTTEHTPHRTLAKRSFPFIIAFLVIALIAALTITLWARNSSEWNDFASEELIIDFSAGQNFATYGFLDRGFLTDHSLDDAPDAPPVYYTHQPPLPILIIGGLISIGIDNLPHVRLVMIFIFLAGLIACMAFFWRLFTPWHGIAVVVLLVLTGRHVLSLADHTTHAYWLGLSFLTLWAVSHAKERSFFLWLAVAAILVTSWTNYIQLMVLLVTLVGLWLVRVPNFTLRRVSLLFGVAALGIGLHIVQNIIVVGPSVAFHDIYYAFGNRIFGDPTREALRAFSQENDIILWGVGVIGETSSGLSFVWREYSYFSIPILFSLAGLISLALLRLLSSSLLALRLLAVFAISSISFALLLPAAASAYYLPIAIDITIAMAGGLFIGELVFALRHDVLPRHLSPAFPVFLRRKLSIPLRLRQLITATTLPLGYYGVHLILVALAGVSIWQTIPLGLRNLEPKTTPPAVAELQILKDFQGESFWTNITPHLVAYYTHSWVIGQVPMEGFKQKDITQAYVIPVSHKSPTWSKVNNPRYFFFSQHNVLWFLPDTGPRLEEYRRYLVQNYPVVAWLPDYSSFVVDMSIGPVGTSRVLHGRQHFDASKYPRLELEESQLEVSSINAPTQGKANLIQAGTEGYWHVKVPKEENPAWVTVDLRTPEAVAVLRLGPRAGHTEQLWDGNRAVLHASNDGQAWTPLATLESDRLALEDDWISFLVMSPRAYRYYRLSIYDHSFLSLGRIELYKVPGSELKIIEAVQQFDLSPYARIPLESSQLEVSSLNEPWGKANLVQPGTEGFWHVKVPRQQEWAWVLVDLGIEQPVSLLRVRPRAGFADQLWNGPAATLEASGDGQAWKTVAILGLDKANIRDDWVNFPLPSPERYRYFRLSISDMSYFSMARLELYAPTD